MTQDLAHDLNHVRRVVASARKLCETEKANWAVVMPAAYLHDCFSYPKDHPQRRNSSLIAAKKAQQFLITLDYPQQYIAEIHHAIVAHSYSAAVTPQSLEAQIVQDADRLDALGAVGIARCIQVSAALDRPLYSVNDPFCEDRNPDDSRFTLDHFFTKLLNLESTMNTVSGRNEAKARTQYMQSYLRQFKHEVYS
ncbi:HD domain-containing protein [Alginatibacterium sediminis]|uniref:HD domain-containing protein n=2 Tax=Alginatibacterium sediminis TaxID=2164068 RepID=A0A420EA28_9ALTE|nr:HD domain-containing protein [Alginatibacterium sediminis]